MNSQEARAEKTKKLLKDFWQEHESKIILAIGALLVAVLAFQAGILKGQKWQPEPLVIERPVAVIESPTSQNNAPQAQNLPPEGAKQAEAVAAQSPATASGSNCAYVGSKNSDKYHVPTCPHAKRIKPENIVCFSSAEDAGAKGYQPDKSCVK